MSNSPKELISEHTDMALQVPGTASDPRIHPCTRPGPCPQGPTAPCNANTCRCLSICYVLDTVLDTHPLLSVTSSTTRYYCPPFSFGDTRARRGHMMQDHRVEP